MTRIIAELDRAGHWSAWFADDPCHAFGGAAAAQAISRLLEDAGHDSAMVDADFEAARDGHMEFTIAGEPCPECGGSGIYIGLNMVEDCRRCRGSGRA